MGFFKIKFSTMKNFILNTEQKRCKKPIYICLSNISRKKLFIIEKTPFKKIQNGRFKNKKYQYFNIKKYKTCSACKNTKWQIWTILIKFWQRYIPFKKKKHEKLAFLQIASLPFISFLCRKEQKKCDRPYYTISNFNKKISKAEIMWTMKKIT